MGRHGPIALVTIPAIVLGSQVEADMEKSSRDFRRRDLFDTVESGPIVNDSGS